MTTETQLMTAEELFDAAFVRRERTVGVDDAGPPIEVISTHGLVAESRAVPTTLMVIVVNPRNHTVQVHTPDGVTELAEDDTLDGGDVLPGWSMPIADIFSK